MKKVFFLAVLSLIITSPLVAHADNGMWHKIALNKEHVVSISADPVQPSTLYAVTSMGLLKSIDRGRNWTKLKGELPSDIPPSAVAVNPFNSQEIFVGFDGRGIFKSNDGGSTWASLNDGLQNLYVRCIVISPKAPNLIYVGIQNGIAITTNGGKLWHMAFGFKRATNVNAVVIDPKNPQFLYAATGGGGVYKSGNGGVSWKDINEGLSSLSILDIHVDPENPDILLAGAYHPATPTDLYVGEASGGVYRSEDGGRTWHETPLLNITIFSFTDHPDLPGVIYAGAWGGAYRSIDKGKTWIDINSGLDNAFLHKVHLLSGTPPEILAGTTFGLLSFTDTEVGEQMGRSSANLQSWQLYGCICTIGLFCMAGVFWLRNRKKRAEEQRDAW